MRRAARIDDNQVEIVKALRKLGASVAVTSAVGNGFPDLVVGFGGKNYLFELKDPKKEPSRRQLTNDQQDFFLAWRGQVNKVETLEEIQALMRW